MRSVSFFLIIFIQITCIKFIKTTFKDASKEINFPPCKACRTLASSFKKGMENTAKGKFEGGDASWEEAKLGSYAKSEIRLIEIQEHLCSDVEDGKNQCYSLQEQHDLLIEDWWFKHQEDEADIYKYLCIDKLEVCCPNFHFGSKCTPCQGYPDKICSNNGKCKGSGTRKGNGECLCNEGYSGKQCFECAARYFASYKDDSKILCSKCHVSCDTTCYKAGSTGCDKCANGWIHDAQKGCLDVNECVTENICNSQQFCVNSEGSYKCLNCDPSCDGCSGDGPDMCKKCARGFTLIDNLCIESEQENRKQYIFMMRYLTYAGLCLATCIIFQRSTILAAVIGVAVAIYMTVSEYMLSNPPTVNTTNIADRIFKSNQ